MSLKRLHRHFEGDIAKMMASLGLDRSITAIINAMTKMIGEEFDYTQKNLDVHPESTASTLTTIVRTEIVTLTAVSGTGVQTASLVVGTQWVPFATSVTGNFALVPLSCIGTIDGANTNVEVFIDPDLTTSSGFSIRVDLACTFRYMIVITA